MPAVGDVRIIGAMAALEFVTDPQTKKPDPAATSRVLAACHSEGVILLKAGTYDNVVRILPPLVISDDLLKRGSRCWKRRSVRSDATGGGGPSAQARRVLVHFVKLTGTESGTTSTQVVPGSRVIGFPFGSVNRVMFKPPGRLQVPFNMTPWRNT